MVIISTILSLKDLLRGLAIVRTMLNRVGRLTTSAAHYGTQVGIVVRVPRVHESVRGPYFPTRMAF